MNKFRLLGIVFLIVLLALIGSVRAQGATDEPTPTVEVTPAATVVVEQPPVVVVETPSEETGPTWFKPSDIILLILGLGLAFSHPPQTGKLFGDIMKRAQDQAAKTPSMLDDAIVEAVTAKIQPRLDAFDKAMSAVVGAPDDGTAVG